MRSYKDFRFVNGYFVVGCSLVVALAVGLKHRQLGRSVAELL